MMFLCVPVLLPEKNKFMHFLLLFQQGAPQAMNKPETIEKAKPETIEKARFSATSNARPANGNSPHPWLSQ